MRPIKVKVSPVTTSATGYASNVTGATWTLTTTTAADSLGHLTTIHNDSATDHSAKTALVTGTDADGKALTETIALPAGTATTTGSKYFKTISTVVPSATVGADTMDIGWSVSAVSKTIPLNYRQCPFNTELSLEITGTVSAGVEHTADSPYDIVDDISGTPTIIGSQTAIYYADPTIVTKSASTEATLSAPHQATRIRITSVTNGATVTYQIVQATD